MAIALELEVMVGTDINTACKEAVAKARRHHAPVHFDFNGKKMIAGPLDSPVLLAQQYYDQCQRAAEAYAQSEEGQIRKRLDEARVKQQQAVVDRLVERLPEIVNDTTALMTWCEHYTEAGDLVGVDHHGDTVRQCLLSQWKENAHVGQKCEWICEESIRIAEYTIGQVINVLGHGYPAHPITPTFVGWYRDQVSKETQQ